MITADDIMILHPCPDWPRERVATIVGAGITPTEIARRPDIPIADRRWVLSQLLAVRDRRALVRWACECAQDVRGTLDEDARDAADCAIQTAVAWTEGAVTAEDCRMAAADAAAYAAYAAARAAARAAYAARAAAAQRRLETAARYLESMT